MKFSKLSTTHPTEDPKPETHPTMFLHQWYGPGIETQYEIENPGFRPQIFACTITVQGRSFQASGPSKKEGLYIICVFLASFSFYSIFQLTFDFSIFITTY